eukprot:997953_1
MDPKGQKNRFINPTDIATSLLLITASFDPSLASILRFSGYSEWANAHTDITLFRVVKGNCGRAPSKIDGAQSEAEISPAAQYAIGAPKNLSGRSNLLFSLLAVPRVIDANKTPIRKR